MVPEAGLEPARSISPTDFESVTSANSIIPANDILRKLSQNGLLEIGGRFGGRFRKNQKY